MRVRFDEFEFDDRTRSLERAGRREPVQSMVVDLLSLLLRNPGRLVAIDVITRTLWPDSVVGADALRRLVKEARRALGDDGRRQQVIETVRGRGLRFIAPIEELSDSSNERPARYAGRPELLDRIDHVLEEALDGRGRILLLSGQAGLGKTRTAEEIVVRARMRGAEVATAWATEEDGVPAYWSWIQILRDMFDARDDDTLRRHLGGSGPELSQLEPRLRARLPGLAMVPSLAPESARIRLFDSIRRFLTRAASDRPLVIVLDDLHWADAHSVQLLRLLAEPMLGEAVLVVGCHRDIEPTADPRRVEPWKKLTSHSSVETIRLLPFSTDDVAVFVAESIGRTPPRKAASELRAASGGSPLLLAELLRASKDHGEDDWSWAAASPVDAEGVIGAWLGGLSTRTRQELRAAAVAGLEFEASMVRRARPSEADFDAALREGVEGRVLVELEEADRFRFAHSVLRDALYDELEDDARVALHREIGASLEKSLGVDGGVDALAHHFFTAFSEGDAQKTIDYSTRAGDDAAAVYASDRAASYYRQALRVLEFQRNHDHKHLCALLIKLGDALSGVGDREGSRAACRRAAEIARREGWPLEQAAAAESFASDYLYLNVPDPEIVSLLEDALERLGPEPSALQARLWTRLAAECCMHPDRALSRQVRGRALEAALASPAPESLAHALASSAHTGIIDTCVPIEERLPLLRRAVESCEASEDRATTLQVQLLLAEEHLARGECDRHDEIVAAAREQAMALGDPVSIGSVGFRETTRALMRGQFQEAENRVNEFFVYGQERMDPRAVGQLWLLSQVIHGAERGRLASIRQSLEGSDSGGDGSVTLASLRAWVFCEVGDLAQAREILDKIMSDLLPPEPDFPIWEAQCAIIAHVCREVGAREYAARVQTLLAPLRGRIITRRHVASHGPASFYLGLLAELGGRLDEAEILLEEAVETAKKVGAPPWLARIHFAHARLLVESGRASDARTQSLLGHAIGLARKLGMARILEQAEQLPVLD